MFFEKISKCLAISFLLNLGLPIYSMWRIKENVSRVRDHQGKGTQPNIFDVFAIINFADESPRFLIENDKKFSKFLSEVLKLRLIEVSKDLDFLYDDFIAKMEELKKTKHLYTNEDFSKQLNLLNHFKQNIATLEGNQQRFSIYQERLENILVNPVSFVDKNADKNFVVIKKKLKKEQPWITFIKKDSDGSTICRKIDKVQYVQLITVDQGEIAKLRELHDKYNSIADEKRKRKWDPDGICSVQAVRNAIYLYEFFGDDRQGKLGFLSERSDAEIFIRWLLKTKKKTSWLESGEIQKLVKYLVKMFGGSNRITVVEPGVNARCSELLRNITKKFNESQNYYHVFIVSMSNVFEVGAENKSGDLHWYTVVIRKEHGSIEYFIADTDNRYDHIRDQKLFERAQCFCKLILDGESKVSPKQKTCNDLGGEIVKCGEISAGGLEGKSKRKSKRKREELNSCSAKIKGKKQKEKSKIKASEQSDLYENLSLQNKEMVTMEKEMLKLEQVVVPAVETRNNEGSEQTLQRKAREKTNEVFDFSPYLKNSEMKIVNGVQYGQIKTVSQSNKKVGYFVEKKYQELDAVFENERARPKPDYEKIGELFEKIRGYSSGATCPTLSIRNASLMNEFFGANNSNLKRYFLEQINNDIRACEYLGKLVRLGKPTSWLEKNDIEDEINNLGISDNVTVLESVLNPEGSVFEYLIKKFKADICYHIFIVQTSDFHTTLGTDGFSVLKDQGYVLEQKKQDFLDKEKGKVHWYVVVISKHGENKRCFILDTIPAHNHIDQALAHTYDALFFSMNKCLCEDVLQVKSSDATRNNFQKKLCEYAVYKVCEKFKIELKEKKVENESLEMGRQDKVKNNLRKKKFFKHEDIVVMKEDIQRLEKKMIWAVKKGENKKESSKFAQFNKASSKVEELRENLRRAGQRKFLEKHDQEMNKERLKKSFWGNAKEYFSEKAPEMLGKILVSVVIALLIAKIPKRGPKGGPSK